MSHRVVFESFAEDGDRHLRVSHDPDGGLDIDIYDGDELLGGYFLSAVGVAALIDYIRSQESA